MLQSHYENSRLFLLSQNHLPAGWKGKNKLSTIAWQAEIFRLINAKAAKPDMPPQPPLCRWREAEWASSHDRGPGAGRQLARMGLTLRDTSHTGQKKASSPDLAQAVSRESCQPGLEPPYQGQQVLYSTDIPSSRAGVCRTTLCCTSPCECRRQQIPSQLSKWFNLKMQLCLDNQSIAIWTAGWRLIPWGAELTARHCTAHTGPRVSSDSRPNDTGIL